MPLRKFRVVVRITLVMSVSLWMHTLHFWSPSVNDHLAYSSSACLMEALESAFTRIGLGAGISTLALSYLNCDSHLALIETLTFKSCTRVID